MKFSVKKAELSRNNGLLLNNIMDKTFYCNGYALRVEPYCGNIPCVRCYKFDTNNAVWVCFDEFILDKETLFNLLENGDIYYLRKLLIETAINKVGGC